MADPRRPRLAELPPGQDEPQPQKQPVETMVARQNDQLRGPLQELEAKHLKGDASFKAVALKPETVDSPGSPVNRHRSLAFRDTKPLGVGLADDSADAAASGIQAGSKGRLAESTDELAFNVRREGSLIMTPAQRWEIVSDALNSQGADFLKGADISERLKDALNPLLSQKLFDLKSSAETTGDVHDVQSDVEGLKDRLDAAKGIVEESGRRLRALGLNGRQAEKILEAAAEKLAETDGDPTSVSSLIAAAAKAAGKSAPNEAGVKPDAKDVLEKANDAFRQDGQYSYMMLKDMMLSARRQGRGEREGLIEWMERLFATEKEELRKAA